MHNKVKQLSLLFCQMMSLMSINYGWGHHLMNCPVSVNHLFMYVSITSISKLFLS